MRFVLLVLYFCVIFETLDSYHSFHESAQCHRRAFRVLYNSGNSASNQQHPKLDFNEDYYSVLEISPTANEKALKKAYYKMVFKYHPDNKEGEDLKDLCNRQMMVINGAYKVLKDPAARANYDRKRRIGVYGNKSGVKSGSKSNASATTQPHRSQSVNSSYRETPPKDYREQKNSYSDTNKESEIPTESMADIFAEMFRDIALNKGNQILNDVNDFLNSQIRDIPSSSSNRNANNRKEMYGQYSAEELASEVVVLKTACKYLKDHIKDLRGTLAVEESLLSMNAKQQGTSSTEADRVAALQGRLQRLESVKGLKARITEAQDQLNQLKNDLDVVLSVQLRRRFSDGNRNSSYQSDGGTSDTAGGVYDNIFRDAYDQVQSSENIEEQQKKRLEQAQRRQQDRIAEEERKKNSIEAELTKLKANIKKK